MKTTGSSRNRGIDRLDTRGSGFATCPREHGFGLAAPSARDALMSEWVLQPPESAARRGQHSRFCSFLFCRTAPESRMLFRRLIAILVLSAPAFLSAEQPQPLRVLFIGNSLTYANDLPAMVARIGSLDGQAVEIRVLARPDASLEDHIASRELRKLLSGRWDWVVLQQGPSSLPESRTALRRDAKKIASLARSPARIALLMVWPPRSRARAWDQVTASYRLASEDVDGVLIPAGEQLRAALDSDPSIPLLSSDGFHPSVAGTYLAALATWRALTNHIPPECAELSTARLIAAAPLGLTGGQLRTVFEAAR